MRTLNNVSQSIVEEVSRFGVVAIAKAPSTLHKVPNKLKGTNSVYAGAYLDCLYIGFDKENRPLVFVAYNSSYLKLVGIEERKAFGVKLTNAINKFKTMLNQDAIE